MAHEASGRANQKRRTRKDLLEAAWRLMKEGHKPSLEEIAEAALVSRATAYRYFQSAEAVMVEASLDGVAPDPETLFQKADAHDAAARLKRVDTALHEMVLNNEAPLRMMLAQSLERALRGPPDEAVPLRQNRRTPLIEAALAPVRDQFDPAALDRLCKAAALIVGTEGMVVCKDVLQLDDMEARRVKAWAIDALVEGARRGKREARSRAVGAR